MKDARGHGNVIYLTVGHLGNSLLEFRDTDTFKSGIWFVFVGESQLSNQKQKNEAIWSLGKCMDQSISLRLVILESSPDFKVASLQDSFQTFKWNILNTASTQTCTGTVKQFQFL